MQPVIKPVDRKLIRRELTAAKYIRTTRKGDNELYEVTYKDSPNIMQEIGRLREISFRLAGGGSERTAISTSLTRIPSITTDSS